MRRRGSSCAQPSQSFTRTASCVTLISAPFRGCIRRDWTAAIEDKGDLIAYVLESRGLDPASAACGATADTTSSRPGGTRSRPSARFGAMAARGNCAPPALRRCARRREKFPRPSRRLPSKKSCDGRPRVTESASRPRPDPGASAPTPAPPRAEARPSELSAHGLVWTDDYAWIRAANWREVLGDPNRLPQDIRALLTAENAYAGATLAPMLALKEEIVREMRSRIEEDDSEPPQVDGPWAYYWRFRRGGQHRIYCRRPRGGGGETVLIDGDARARGHAFFQLAAARHSPDHAKFAWSSDDLGSEMHVIAVERRGARAGPRRPRRRRDRRHRLDRRFAGVFVCRAGREPSTAPRAAASAWNARRARTSKSSARPTPPGSSRSSRPGSAARR